MAHNMPDPNVTIGDYTYYDDPQDPTGFEKNNILFNYPEFGLLFEKRGTGPQRDHWGLHLLRRPPGPHGL